MKEKVNQIISLTVNGKQYEFAVGTGHGMMPENELLSDTLRYRLGFTGLKIGCGQGACGCCTVIMNGQAVTSCMTFTMDCDEAKITTIAGLADPETGQLNDLQQAFIDHAGYQCGFCIPGVIMSAQALLDRVETPTEGEVREALAGNYCRCGTHYTAVESVMACVEKRRVGK